MKFRGLLQIAFALALPTVASLGCTAVNEGVNGVSVGSTVTTATPAPVATTLPQGQCSNLDPSSPELNICINCYNNVLATQCPGASTPDTCQDPAIPSQFTNLVNQCISQTVAAGFTCNLSCASGTEVNPATCTCVPTSTISSGTGSGTGGTDVGQTDAGAPSVTIQFPSLAANTVLVTAASCTIDLSTNPIYFGVANRGSAPFDLNAYTVQAPSPEPSNGAGSLWIESGTLVAPFSFNSFTYGLNTEAYFTVQSGATQELPGLAGVTGSLVTKYLPTPTPSPSPTQVATGGYPGLSVLAASGLQEPWMAARDADGNVYFTTETIDGVPIVGAICGIAAQAGTPCAGQAVGSVQTVASVVATTTLRGIAVDSSGNIYVTATLAADDTKGTVYKVVGGGLVSQGITGKSGIQGLDVHTSGGLVNYYIAEMSGGAAHLPPGATSGTTYSGQIEAVCGWRESFGLCSGGGPPLPVAIPSPSDVKENLNGNLVVASAGMSMLYGICYQTGTGDFCNAPEPVPGPVILAPGTIIPLAGVWGAPGDSGDGGPVSVVAPGAGNPYTTNVQITSPWEIAIGKAFNDDYGNPSYSSFRDNNIVFTERYSPGSSTVPASGSTVRVLCGDNSLLSDGLCIGAANNVIFRLAGQPGQLGGGNQGNGLFSTQALLVDPTALAYDGFKNLDLGSGQYPIPTSTPNFSDRSIRTINYAAPSQILGVKYAFTDSNELSATYCLQFQVLTSCQGTTCTCQLIPPAGSSSSLFNSISSSSECPGTSIQISAP